MKPNFPDVSVEAYIDLLTIEILKLKAEREQKTAHYSAHLAELRVGTLRDSIKQKYGK